MDTSTGGRGCIRWGVEKSVCGSIGHSIEYLSEMASHHGHYGLGLALWTTIKTPNLAWLLRSCHRVINRFDTLRSPSTAARLIILRHS